MLTAVALAGAVTGCSATPATPATPTTTPTVAAGTPTPTPTAFQGDLKTLVLTIPAGAAATKGPNSPADGVIDVKAQVASSGLTEAQVKAAGFVKGFSSEWLEADGTWVGVILTQFNDPSHAAQWASAGRSGFEADKLFAAGVPIPGVDNGKVYARTSVSGNGRWFTEAVFARNTISVELFVTSPVHHAPQKTIDLAAAQYARLP